MNATAQTAKRPRQHPRGAGPSASTSVALHGLRGFAVLMVVAFHASIAYIVNQPAATPPFDAAPYAWTVNPVVDQKRWLGIDLFCALQYSYLMHLMFFLSGLFVWPGIVRSGPQPYILNRLVRLGLPFVLGTGVLMPVAYYPVYLLTAAEPGPLPFLDRWLALPFWPSGPLWFLWVLLLFNCIVAMIYRPMQRIAPSRGWPQTLAVVSLQSRARPARYFWTLVAVSAAACVPLGQLYEPWQWLQFGPFAFQPAFILQYLVFFLAGVGLGAAGLDRGLVAPDGELARRWRHWLGAVVPAFMAWILPLAVARNGDGSASGGLRALSDLGFALTSATSCFALMAFFVRFSASIPARFIDFAACSFGIYLVHYALVIWLQYALLDTGMAAVAKALVVFTGTTLLSWAAASAFGRFSPSRAPARAAQSLEDRPLR